MTWTKETYATYARNWRNTHKEHYLARDKARREALILEVYNAYGGAQCACCGEAELKFLTLDHINNDGNKHRKEISGKTRDSRMVYYWLKRNGFPPGYQILCYNCNCGKSRNKGICPHKEEKENV